MRHRDLMAAYYEQRDAWCERAIANAAAYDTEQAEYAERNLRPTFKAFLISLAGERAYHESRT